MVEWLTLLLPIQKVPVSNLGTDTGYARWGLSLFYSVPPGEFGDITLNLGHDRFLQTLSNL
jgi:hypothetical protein